MRPIAMALASCLLGSARLKSDLASVSLWADSAGLAPFVTFFTKSLNQKRRRIVIIGTHALAMAP